MQGAPTRPFQRRTQLPKLAIWLVAALIGCFVTAAIQSKAADSATGLKLLHQNK